MAEAQKSDHGDQHSCASCELLFTSLEDYVHHKMTNEKCGKNLNFDKKKVLQQLMGPPSSIRGRRRGRPPLSGRCRQLHDTTTTTHTKTGSKSERSGDREGKYNRLHLHHKQSDIISDRSGYTCTRCPRSFRRQAALNRHMEYDHRGKMSDESDVENTSDTEVRTTIDGEDKDYAPSSAMSGTGIIEVIHIQDVSDLPAQVVVPSPPASVHKTSHVLNVSKESDTTADHATSTPKPCIIKVVNQLNCADQVDRSSAENVNNAEYMIIPQSTNTPDSVEVERVDQSETAHTAVNTSIIKHSPDDHDDSKPTPAVQEIKVEQNLMEGNNCLKCCRSFKDKYVLRAHMLTHSNMRTYRCTFKGCSYASKTKGSLKRHTRRHTGERPFKCKLCGRAFRESGCLARHLKSRGVCSDRSDSDFPRYRKNLRFKYTVENEENFRKSQAKATKHAGPKVIQITSEPTLSQIVQEAEQEVEESVRWGSEREVVLVPVSPSRASEIDHITAEDGNKYIQLTSTDDLTQLMPVTVSQTGGVPQQEILWTVISEEEIHSHQGLSLEVAAECGQQQRENEQQQMESEQPQETDVQMLTNSDNLHETSADLQSEQLQAGGQLETGSDHFQNVQFNAENELMQVDCHQDAHDERGQEETRHYVIKSEPDTEQDMGDQTMVQLVDAEELHTLAEPAVKVLSPVKKLDTLNNRQAVELLLKQKQDSDLVVIHQSQIKQEIDELPESFNHVQTVPLQENLQTFTCIVDKQSFDSKQKLEAHLKTHMLHQKYSCNRCTFSTDNHTDMVDHMQISHLKRWVMTKPDDSTTVEGTEISDKSTVIAPQANAQEQETEEYSYQFVSISDESTEAQTESQQNQGVKEACLALEQLRELKEEAKGPVGQTECVVCEKSFKSSTTLKNHMLLHTGDKCHKCGKCEKLFYTKDSLNKHLVAHSVERNYKCGECGKMFKRISHVREHLKVHSNYRPYPCRICFRLFKSVNACKVHMRTHTDVLQHECPKCHKHFREKGALQRHIRTHTGEKPFACPHCNRKFAEHGTLKRHLKAKVPCTKELYGYRMQQSGESSATLPAMETAGYAPEQDMVLDDAEVVEVAVPGLLASEEVVQVAEEGVDATGGEVECSSQGVTATDALVLSGETGEGAAPDNVQYIYMDNSIHTDGQVILIAGSGQDHLELTVQPTEGSTDSGLLQGEQQVVAMDKDSTEAMGGLSVVDDVVVHGADEY